MSDQPMTVSAEAPPMNVPPEHEPAPTCSPMKSHPEEHNHPEGFPDIDRLDEVNISPSKNGTQMVMSDAETDHEETEGGSLVPDTDMPVRARVFALADSGNWEDIATGVFHLENDPQHGCQYFRVLSESHEDECMFEAIISVDKMVSLQNDSVLGWKPEDGRDIALSFEYASCLSDVWHRICVFQRRPPEFEYFGGHVKIALPELAEPNTIPVIESSMVLYSNFNGLRGPLAELILEQCYIPQLLDQFKIALAAGDQDLVTSIFNIFRMMVLLNVNEIFDEIFSSGSAAAVAQIFEYDPALETKPEYRSFILDESKVKSLFPLHNLTLETAIHRTIRIQFFKDVILPRYLDDEVFSSLTMLARSCLNDVVNMFDSQPRNYERLAGLFTSDDPTRQLEILKFFKDFIGICRASNMRQLAFFKSPIFQQLLGFLQKVLSNSNWENPAVTLSSELLLSLTQLDSVQVQSWMLEQKSHPAPQQILSTVIDRIHAEPRASVRWNLVSVLRLLLDPPNPTSPMAAQLLPSFEAFSDYFYAQQCIRLISPFSQVDKILKARRLTETEADMYFHLCELTSSFVLLHKYKIKYQLVRDHCLVGISLLMRSHASFLSLASLRVFRTLTSVRDEFYSRIIVSNRVFDEIFCAFAQTAHRNNLLRAAFLDFFVSLHAAPCHKLVDELVTRYREKMESYAELHEVFPRLVQLYDSNYAIDASSQLNDTQMSTGVEVTTHVTPDEVLDTSISKSPEKWGSIDAKEEDYFSSADETMTDDLQPLVLAADSSPDTLLLPPTHRPKAIAEAEEEFGGALGGGNASVDNNGNALFAAPKKISIFGANLKNTLKTGFGLWKTSPSPSAAPSSATTSPSPEAASTSPSSPPADPIGEEAPASPSKKSKHAE